MEIQQKEKESLTAYIHHFKTEAKRCNFTNNADTIRIFVKGLKNTHSLATRIYEKGPQTLADTISQVEKLQAAHQLTATFIPSLTVNIVSLGRSLFSVPGIRLHSMSLSQCLMFRV